MVMYTAYFLWWSKKTKKKTLSVMNSINICVLYSSISANSSNIDMLSWEIILESTAVKRTQMNCNVDITWPAKNGMFTAFVISPNVTIFFYRRPNFPFRSLIYGENMGSAKICIILYTVRGHDGIIIYHWIVQQIFFSGVWEDEQEKRVWCEA